MWGLILSMQSLCNYFSMYICILITEISALLMDSVLIVWNIFNTGKQKMLIFFDSPNFYISINSTVIICIEAEWKSMNTGEDVLHCVFVFVQVSSAVEKSAAAWCSCQEPDDVCGAAAIHHLQSIIRGGELILRLRAAARPALSSTSCQQGSLLHWLHSRAVGFMCETRAQRTLLQTIHVDRFTAIHCAAVCRVFLRCFTRVIYSKIHS